MVMFFSGNGEENPLRFVRITERANAERWLENEKTVTENAFSF